MNDNEFWIRAWQLVAAVICTLILTIGGCEIHRQYEVAELVRDGADPIKANCGVVGIQNHTSAAICAQAVSK